ncbi:hypothetical protein [Actinomadura bangladeshensis]|uniref:Uncharacterized protein n=1 Tax=Actinomadura bangladeshensis TaxID=453573 RepID=A0A4V2XJW5_9ACTN|nr:hypothetical protein [Actinomadura bangladeshensis]TDC04216.1 hypothetical protein E1284_37210 [Actinomadura bangladeshensis]
MSKRADRLAALDEELERRLPARYARRRPRRILAGAGAVTLGLFWVDAAVSWVLAPSDTAMIANFVILGVLVVVGFPLAGQLMAVTRGLTSKREDQLDERQLLARLRAYASAHRATTFVLAAVLIVTSVADTDGRESQIPGAALFLILFAMLATHMLLPLVVATWQTADPPADEDDEDDERDQDEPAA